MLLALTFLLFCFVIWRMIWPLKVKWYIKVLLALPLAAGAFKFQCFRVLGGHYFSPDLPGWIILGGAWLYGGFYFIPPMLFCSEAVRFFKFRNEQKIWNHVNAVIIIAAALLSAVAIGFGAADPRVTCYTVEHPQLPAAADGMKVAFITDLHIDHTTDAGKIHALVEKVNSLGADLITCGGDLMDGSVEKCGSKLKILTGLKAPFGVLGIPGNHEYYSGAEEWFGFFSKNSPELLINKSVTLPNGVIVAGVGESVARKFFRYSPELAKKYGEDAEGVLKNIPREKFVLFLAHRPKAALESREFGADLQLSGHTHGGMIRGFDLLVGLYNCGWVSGRYKTKDLTLIVSNGTWLWRGFPLRLGRPGEILLVTLKRAGK